MSYNIGAPRCFWFLFMVVLTLPDISAQAAGPMFQSDLVLPFYLPTASLNEPAKTEREAPFKIFGGGTTQQTGNEQTPPLFASTGLKCSFPSGDRKPAISLGLLFARQEQHPLRYSNYSMLSSISKSITDRWAIAGGLRIGLSNYQLSGPLDLRPWDAGDTALPLPDSRTGSSVFLPGLGFGFRYQSAPADPDYFVALQGNYSWPINTWEGANKVSTPFEKEILFATAESGLRVDVTLGFSPADQVLITLRTYLIEDPVDRWAYGMMMNGSLPHFESNRVEYLWRFGLGYEPSSNNLRAEVGLRFTQFSISVFSRTYITPLYNFPSLGIMGTYLLPIERRK